MFIEDSPSIDYPITVSIDNARGQGNEAKMEKSWSALFVGKITTPFLFLIVFLSRVIN